MIALSALVLSACSSRVTVATFNIRFFPEPSTDVARVAETVAELPASIIAVQEIRDVAAMHRMLADASRRSGRDYRLLPGPCGGRGEALTTGVIYDARRWTVLEHMGYPGLEPDGACGREHGQPGTLGVFEGKRGERVGVLSVHLWPFPRRFAERREQWAKVVELVTAARRRHGVPILAMGDYNSTGYRGEPPQEKSFIEATVDAAGFTLPTADIPCTEYWRPPDSDGDYLPSTLDHVVTAGGRWEPAAVKGLCERMACQPRPEDELDPDFKVVSDHCPVVTRGAL